MQSTQPIIPQEISDEFDHDGIDSIHSFYPWPLIAKRRAEGDSTLDMFGDCDRCLRVVSGDRNVGFFYRQDRFIGSYENLPEIHRKL